VPSGARREVADFLVNVLRHKVDSAHTGREDTDQPDRDDVDDPDPSMPPETDFQAIAVRELAAKLRQSYDHRRSRP